MADKTEYRWDGPKATWDTTEFLLHGEGDDQVHLSRSAPADQRVISLTDDEAKDLKQTQKLVRTDGSDSQPESSQDEDSSGDEPKGSEQQKPGAAGTAGTPRQGAGKASDK